MKTNAFAMRVGPVLIAPLPSAVLAVSMANVFSQTIANAISTLWESIAPRHLFVPQVATAEDTVPQQTRFATALLVTHHLTVCSQSAHRIARVMELA